MSLIDIACQASTAIREALDTVGAVLFRGFHLENPAAMVALAELVDGGVADYDDQHTPRQRVDTHVFTSTEYAPSLSIELHSEMSYSNMWPRSVWFLCEEPAPVGGATPIADNRRVLSSLSADLVARFEKHGVAYVRNLGCGLAQPWQTALGVDAHAAAERACLELGLEWAWQEGGGLWVRAVRPAVIAHPTTHERVWFNQAHAFHPSSLPVAVRRSLEASLTDDLLPNNATFGDAAPIDETDLEEVRLAYRAAAVDVAWQRGDVLVVDNVLTAHGRRPYEGARRVLVTLGGPGRAGGGAREA